MKIDCMARPISHSPHNISLFASSIGDSAKNAYPSNPSNTVFDAKRLIGRKVNDPDVLRDIKHWPFKVSEKNGKPAISVKYKGELRDFVCSFV
jgi:molecular chaperone DnaK (HSP70)